MHILTAAGVSAKSLRSIQSDNIHFAKEHSKCALSGKDYAEYDLSGVPAGTSLVIENSKGFGAGGLIIIE